MINNLTLKIWINKKNRKDWIKFTSENKNKMSLPRKWWSRISNKKFSISNRSLCMITRWSRTNWIWINKSNDICRISQFHQTSMSVYLNRQMLTVHHKTSISNLDRTTTCHSNSMEAIIMIKCLILIQTVIRTSIHNIQKRKLTPFFNRTSTFNNKTPLWWPSTIKECSIKAQVESKLSRLMDKVQHRINSHTTTVLLIMINIIKASPSPLKFLTSMKGILLIQIQISRRRRDRNSK